MNAIPPATIKETFHGVSGEMPLLAVTLKLNVPSAVGVPEKIPVETPI